MMIMFAKLNKKPSCR